MNTHHAYIYNHPMTDHARRRMYSRGISPAAIRSALRYGRIIHVRGVKIYAIGRREVDRYMPHGVDLSRFEGVQVVCTPHEVVRTVYRNRDFRGLRPRHRRH